MASPSEEQAEYVGDQQLQECVRDYWHQWRVLDAGEAGVLDEDKADDMYGEMNPRVVAALIEAIMERSGWDADRTGDEVRHSFTAAGIGVTVQVSFPEWAVPDQAG